MGEYEGGSLDGRILENGKFREVSCSSFRAGRERGILPVLFVDVKVVFDCILLPFSRPPTDLLTASH